MDKDTYEHELRKLRIELVKSQIWAIGQNQKALVIFEGRDGAGKDGVIKRITEHLSPRNTRVVALPKPSGREQSEWYFQRYVRHLPSGGEWVLFNRSWYNRAGVEVAMGFSTPAEQEQFLIDVPSLERMVVQSGAQVIKYWLDVSREEQHRRLKERRTDPIKQLKTGPMDVEAEKRFDAYTRARDEMLIRTHTPVAPWICVRSDNKKAARINVIRHLLHAIGNPGLAKKTPAPDSGLLFPFEVDALNDGRLAR
jgi:polyphosphate kinase 2